MIKLITNKKINKTIIYCLTLIVTISIYLIGNQIAKPRPKPIILPLNTYYKNHLTLLQQKISKYNNNSYSVAINKNYTKYLTKTILPRHLTIKPYTPPIIQTSKDFKHDQWALKYEEDIQDGNLDPADAGIGQDMSKTRTDYLDDFPPQTKYYKKYMHINGFSLGKKAWLIFPNKKITFLPGSRITMPVPKNIRPIYANYPSKNVMSQKENNKLIKNFGFHDEEAASDPNNLHNKIALTTNNNNICLYNIIDHDNHKLIWKQDNKNWNPDSLSRETDFESEMINQDKSIRPKFINHGKKKLKKTSLIITKQYKPKKTTIPRYLTSKPLLNKLTQQIGQQKITNPYQWYKQLFKKQEKYNKTHIGPKNTTHNHKKLDKLDQAEITVYNDFFTRFNTSYAYFDFTNQGTRKHLHFYYLTADNILVRDTSIKQIYTAKGHNPIPYTHNPVAQPHKNTIAIQAKHPENASSNIPIIIRYNRSYNDPNWYKKYSKPNKQISLGDKKYACDPQLWGPGLNFDIENEYNAFLRADGALKNNGHWQINQNPQNIQNGWTAVKQQQKIYNQQAPKFAGDIYALLDMPTNNPAKQVKLNKIYNKAKPPKNCKLPLPETKSPYYIIIKSKRKYLSVYKMKNKYGQKELYVRAAASQPFAKSSFNGSHTCPYWSFVPAKWILICEGHYVHKIN